MRHIHLDYVEPGQILGKSIYTSDGRTLLNAGVQLTVAMINKLRRIGVTMVYIQDSQFQDIKLSDVVSDETRREAISNVSQAFQMVQEGKNFDPKAITHTVGNIMDEIMRNRNVLIHLSDIRTYDNDLFVHSTNVCIMSTVIGLGMGMNVKQLKDLAVGALLHDIGKAPQRVREDEVDEVLNGKNKENHPDVDDPVQQEIQSSLSGVDQKFQESYSENKINKDVIEQHTWRGFNLLRRKHEVSIVAAHVALQHHEHIDGTGFPRQLNGEDIHPFAKIVAVANYYDNLISPIKSGKQYRPHEAYEQIMGLANIRFDHETVIHFLRSIALYPTGTSVKLSTGEVGVVVRQHKGLPARPVVRVIKKSKFDTDDEPNIYEVDLAKATTTFITEVLDG